MEIKTINLLRSGFRIILKIKVDGKWMEVWEEIPQVTIRRPSGACPDVVGSAYRHVEATHTTEPHFELSRGISTEVGSACVLIFHPSFSTLILSMILNPDLNRLMI